MLNITTVNDTPDERAVEERLRALLKRYDASRYFFTSEVRIERGALPHSHPVLTLGTRAYDDGHLLLADFVHEQLHWFLVERDMECKAAISDLRQLYRDVPVGHPDGGRDAFSTYLHLVLCPLEHVAMVELIGEPAALEVRRFWQTDHYCWIYRTVESDWANLTAVIERHGLTL